MRIAAMTLTAVTTALLGFALAGCEHQPLEVAPEGAAVAAHVPVGPVPGAGQPPAIRNNPYDGNPVATVEGRRLFNWYNCSGCHGGHGGGGMGPSLRDAVWIYGGSPAHIFDSIAQGRSNGMPAWGSKIPQDQIWKITTYIRTMRTPAEPDPPIVPPNEQVAEPSINPVPATLITYTPPK